MELSAPAEKPQKPVARNPLIALVLSFVIPGLGHMYVGMPRAAFLLGIVSIWALPIWVMIWAKTRFFPPLFLWGFLLLPLLLRFGAAMSAALIARKTQPQALRRWQSPLGYATFFLLFFMSTTLAENYVYGSFATRFAVQNDGAAPKVNKGDGVWIVRTDEAAKPRKGALAVFRRLSSEQTSAVFVQAAAPVIGRIVAVSGDEVEVTPEAVWVNGAALPDSGGGKALPKAPLGEGRVFLLASKSSAEAPDSRELGPMPVGDYVGEVALVQHANGTPVESMNTATQP